MLNTDAHNPRLTGQARMTKAQFIEGNRRTPDLAPLSEEFMSQLYDEIVVNEIKIEGGAEELEAAASPQPPRSPARPGLEGGRQRRRSLSDMFDTAPVRSRASAHGDGAPVCCSVFGPQPIHCRLLGCWVEAAVT